MEKDPSSPLTISRKMPDSSFRATTVTPGSTAPCWSRTRPRNCPVPCCASAGAAVPMTTATHQTTRARRIVGLLWVQGLIQTPRKNEPTGPCGPDGAYEGMSVPSIYDDTPPGVSGRSGFSCDHRQSLGQHHVVAE